MIQPHELMEGNYFQWHELASMGRGVDVITPKNHYTYTEFKDPIPLNKEWLIKFGYEAYGNQFSFHKEDSCFFVVLDPLTNVVTFHLKKDNYLFLSKEYVHSFQNTHQSLTGEQLTIKE